jgi:hypothetical protein
VCAALPKDKAYQLSDSAGLFLYIKPRNHKSWRFTFRFEGKQQLLALASYLAMSLAEARERRFDASKLLVRGLRSPSCRTAHKACRG